jgi:hypothetical protein
VAKNKKSTEIAPTASKNKGFCELAKPALSEPSKRLNLIRQGFNSFDDPVDFVEALMLDLSEGRITKRYAFTQAALLQTWLKAADARVKHGALEIREAR